MTRPVAGYIIVRMPRLNRHSIASTSVHVNIPQLGGVYYAGVDRMAWHCLQKEEQEVESEASIAHDRKIFEHYLSVGINAVGTFADVMDIWSSMDDAERGVSEVLYVTSSIEGSGHDSLSEYLGVDPFDCGSVSLLLSGLYKFPDAFSGWEKHLNSNGIFSNVSQSEIYVAEYFSVADADQVKGIDRVEPFGGNLEHLHVFRIEQAAGVPPPRG